MRRVTVHGDAKGHRQRRMDEEVVAAVSVPDQTGAFVLREGDGGGIVGAVGDQTGRCRRPELCDEAVVGRLAADGFFELGDEDFLPVLGVMFELLVGFAGGGTAGCGRGGCGVAVGDGGGFGAFEGFIGVVAGEGYVGGSGGWVDAEGVEGLRGGGCKGVDRSVWLSNDFEAEDAAF